MHSAAACMTRARVLSPSARGRRPLRRELTGSELIALCVAGGSSMVNISSVRLRTGHLTPMSDFVGGPGPLTECHIDYYYSRKRPRGWTAVANRLISADSHVRVEL